MKKTLRGPLGVRLILDTGEIFPDDPGNGTTVQHAKDASMADEREKSIFRKSASNGSTHLRLMTRSRRCMLPVAMVCSE